MTTDMQEEFPRLPHALCAPKRKTKQTTRQRLNQGTRESRTQRTNKTFWTKRNSEQKPCNHDDTRLSISSQVKRFHSALGIDQLYVQCPFFPLQLFSAAFCMFNDQTCSSLRSAFWSCVTLTGCSHHWDVYWEDEKGRILQALPPSTLSICWQRKAEIDKNRKHELLILLKFPG